MAGINATKKNIERGNRMEWLALKKQVSENPFFSDVE